MNKLGIDWAFALVGMFVVATMATGGQPVADPVAELLRAGISDDEEVFIARFDWNEDGKDDLLLTTGASVAAGDRYGGDWEVWLSNSVGTYSLAPGEGVQALPGILSVVRLPETGNTKAIVEYEHISGGSSGVAAYYLTSDGRVALKSLGEIHQNEDRPEDVALVKRTFEAADEIETTRTTAAQLRHNRAPIAAARPASSLRIERVGKCRRWLRVSSRAWS